MLNEDLDEIIWIIKSSENSGVLIDVLREIVKSEIKVNFFVCY